MASPMFLSTGGGLYSTIEDYSHLSEMLLDDGLYRGRRILKEETVKFMRTPTQSTHLKKEMYSTPVGNNLKGYAYNNLVRILTEPEEAEFMGVHGNIGEFGWDGLAGNFMWIDPAANLYGLFMIQTAEGADLTTRRDLYKTFYDVLNQN